MFSQELPDSNESGRFAILKEPLGCQFGFYSPEEIRKISVKRVISAISFDAFGHPLEGGLYDPAMGPLDRDSGLCKTCGLNYHQCPGHIGHLELVVPTYNPIVFLELYRLLNMMCLECHHFRHSRLNMRIWRTIILLCEANMYEEASSIKDKVNLIRTNEKPLEEIIRNSMIKQKKKPEGYSDPVDIKVMEFLAKQEALARKRLSENELRDMASSSAQQRGGMNPSRVKMHMHTRTLWRDTMKEFLSSCPDRCKTCNTAKPKFRKDGYKKIFRKLTPVAFAKHQLEENNKLNKMLRKQRSADGAEGDDEDSTSDSDNGKEEEQKARASSSGEDDDDDDDESDASSDDDDDEVDEEEEQDKKATKKKKSKKATKANIQDGDAGPSIDLTKKKKKRTKFVEAYMHPLEVQNHLKELWKNELPFVTRIWGRDSYRKHMSPNDAYMLFFVQCLAIPASRFRPPASAGAMKFEHPQNVNLQKILQLDERIRSRFDHSSSGEDEQKMLTFAFNDWVDLQEYVIRFIDSSRSDERDPAPGVRQLLERKEGLFRQNMMGKRVNYAARSVISPDPYIGTDEVGLPLRFAKELAYPEPVTTYNCEMLAEMVRNGPEKHPGALFIEDEQGRTINLAKQTSRKRAILADQLLVTSNGSRYQQQPGFSSRTRDTEDDSLFRQENRRAHACLALGKQKKVWRHVISGDVMLANRQPTLHKPSLMAHKVRVIQNESMQTIRLHYANCNSYNADFDGDEINLHLPQSELCRAEAFEVAYTNHQYCSTTDGKPLRGLIQDHVVMGVMLTKQDTFLTREQYSQLVYVACGSMKSRAAHIKMLPPTILKPQQLWSGKQVISTILMHLIGTANPKELITFGPRKTKTSNKSWAEFGSETDGVVLGQTQVIVRQGELCTGVLDKAQFGASEHGLVHSIYELYGPNAAGELLSSFGRLFTYCAQLWGHTCAIEDLLLNREAETFRTESIKQSVSKGVQVSAKFAGVDENEEDLEKIAKALEKRVRINKKTDNDEAVLDAEMQRITSAVTSEIIQECLPKGQRKPFPENCFSLMVNSGAKGSLVNHSQVSCALGQQALEGRRVPRTIFGKSLPCFSPFDPTPRAGGYVSDRFLTGVRPQEYYFHCMAGREGLIDTAVKTARSGYLQRCLVKHLEGLSVNYDRTIRQPDGSCVQFSYGGDGLDSLNTSFLSGTDETLRFLYSNSAALVKRFSLGGDGKSNEEDDSNNKIQHPKSMETKLAEKYHKLTLRSLQKTKKLPKYVLGTALFTDAHVKARRPVRVRNRDADISNVSEANLSGKMFPGKITKIHKDSGRVDIKFDDTGDTLRNMPVTMDREPLLVEGSRQAGACGSPMSTSLVIGHIPDPVMAELAPDRHLGSISEALQAKIDQYLKKNPDNLRSQEKNHFRQLVWYKYMQSLCAPGENVGVIAAQSIGEPSTQMTLNTFHLAGHGAGNVTLGIPRLRELLMTASTKIKTPSMTLPLLEGVSKLEAEQIRARMYRLPLIDLIRAKDGIIVDEVLCRISDSTGKTERGFAAALASKSHRGSGRWVREYRIDLRLQPVKYILGNFNDLTMEDISTYVAATFCTQLCKLIKSETRRNTGRIIRESKGNEPAPGDDKEEEEQNEDPQQAKNRANESDDDDDEDDDDLGAEKGENDTLRLGGRKEIDGYDDDEDDDNSSSSDSSDDDEENDEDEDDGDDNNDDKKKKKKKDNKGKRKTIGDESSEEEKMEVEDITPQTGQISNVQLDRKLFATLNKYPFFHKFVFQEEAKDNAATLRLILRFDASHEKILMIGLAEQVARASILKSVDKIKASYVVEGSGESKDISIQTDGCNFQAAWELQDYVDVNRIKSNDVYNILLTYGVEAARASIVEQVKGVFGVYGIEVDERHLGLVADNMTFEGGYRPLNRSGIASSSSPFVRMTFETSTNFMKEAALQGETDGLISASSRLCLGQLVKSGTGMFDLLVPNSVKPEKKKASFSTTTKFSVAKKKHE